VDSLSCSGGRCTSTCVAGYANCNQPAAPTGDDGCETPLKAVYHVQDNTGGVDQLYGDLATARAYVNTGVFRWPNGVEEIAFYVRTTQASGTVRLFQCSAGGGMIYFVSTDCGANTELYSIGYVDSAASLCSNSKRIWVLEWAVGTGDYGQYLTTNTCAATSLWQASWTPRPDIAWYAWDFQPPDSCPAPW
jgi:hypothetical protein